jgi:hypothetical protein
MLPRRTVTSWPFAIAASAACALVVITFLVLLHHPSRPKLPVYKGKSLEAWFFGSRKDFFYERTRSAAQDAINGLGTNSFPFLLALLKESHGNGAIYFRLYQPLPPRVQAKLPYPISDDDLKAITLDHIRRMPRLPSDQVRALAECVPDFANPRVRMIGFNLMLQQYQTHPDFLPLCRRLLNDAHPGVQLPAAIYLAQSAIVSDPAEPRLFPLLIGALESKPQRKTSLDLQKYAYQKQPPGGAGPLASPPLSKLFPGLQDPDIALQNEIVTALARLERYLTQEQKNRFNLAGRQSRSPERVGGTL